MSSTEIFCFDKNGDAAYRGAIPNAWRGAMAIWCELEERYLPQFRPASVPSYIPDDQIERVLHYKPRRATWVRFGKDELEPAQEIWDLYRDARLPEHEKIVLGTTFDHVLVKKEHLPRIIEAFEKFDGVTSLAEQAEILKKMYADPDCTAVGWNQTSVIGDHWLNAGGVDEDGDDIPYNYRIMEQHWWLFDDEGNLHE